MTYYVSGCPLLQARWLEGLRVELLAVLRGLPIFRRACAAELAAGSAEVGVEAGSPFMDVGGESFLPPRGFPGAALPPSFVAATDDSQAELVVKVRGGRQRWLL